MSWYYADAGKQNGPITESDWGTLVANGTIKPDTLVWREGMANWTPFSALGASAPPAAAALATVAPGSVRCVECGNTFPVDQVVTIEGQPVCAACKPMVMQKLKEGVALVGEMRYAGFWIRFGAKFIDGIILQIIVRGIGLVAGIGLGAAGTRGSEAATALSVIIGLVVGVSYSIYFNGKYGATPGKMACKLRIVRPDGSPITYSTATGRYFAEILSSLILLIGYIMAGFDEEKRALHDRLCDTRVIHIS